MRILERAAALLVLSAGLVVPRAGAQSVVVGPLPAGMTAFPGASLTLPVVADLTSSGGASLGSIAARLTWRPGTLAFVSAGPGTLGAPTVNADSAASGILKFAVANASGVTGMPVLLNLTFNVTGAPADTTVLGLSVSEITAAGTFADLKPITTTTGARFCTSTGVFGDLDGNGTIDAHDALIIVTNAVGLPIAPYSVVNGDVDGSGVVDTRDALIVLSQAVGINVSQFRIGRVNPGVCSLRSAASVQIQPRTPTVAPGDSLPVTATVRDSTGALVQGIGLVWASKDATIARVGAAGNVVAVAPGSTFATVFVQPGVKDSVPVTVTSARHVWYVNPAVAAGNAGVELGSQSYPFSTIDTAVVRAAAGDTVRVAPADYGPLKVTKPLVLLGDSGATGFPRLTNPSGLALFMDSIPGAVEVRGFRLLNSGGGLAAMWVPTLTLGQVSVEGARGKGIGVHAVDSVNFSRTAVVGAVSEGIKLDSIRIAVLTRVRSDVISRAQGDSGWPLALGAKHVGTLIGDSIGLGTAGANLDSLGVVALRWIGVGGSQGPALWVRADAVSVVHGDFWGASPSGMPTSWDPNSYAVSLLVGSGTVQFDSSRVHDNGLFGLYVDGGTAVSLRADTVAHNFPGTQYDASSAIFPAGPVRVAQSGFVQNGPGFVDIEGYGSNTATVDSTTFDATQAYAYGFGTFLMHGGSVKNGIAPVLGVDYVGRAEFDSVEVTGNGFSGEFNLALKTYGVDTVVLNGLNAHDNASGAAIAWNAAALRINGGTFLNNAFERDYYFSPRTTIASAYNGDVRIYGVTLRDSADVGIRVDPTGSSRAVVDSSALEGSKTLLLDSHCCIVSADTLIVSRSSLTGFGGTSQYGVDAEYLAKLVVTGSSFDSLLNGAMYAYGVDTTVASGNAIRNWGDAGFITYYGGGVTADSTSFAGCSPYGTAIQVYQPGTTRIVGDSVTGCGAFLYVQGASISGGPAVQVRGNTIVNDTTSSNAAAMALTRGLGYVEVVGNTIVHYGGYAGIVLSGESYAIDSARVDSNVVRQVTGYGVALNQVGAPLRVTYNLLADNLGDGLLTYAPIAATFNTVVRNQPAGVVDSSSAGSSFRLGNVVGNVRYGILSSATRTVADSNWWGRSQGPKCVAGCDTTTTATGDSISGNIAFIPVVDTGAVAGAPAIPAPPAVPIARPLAVRTLVAPRAPQSPLGVLRPGTAQRVPARPAVRPAPARPARPAVRQPGHHMPSWKAGGRP